MPGAHVRLSQWVWGCPLERLTRGLATEAGTETVGGCALRAEQKGRENESWANAEPSRP